VHQVTVHSRKRFVTLNKYAYSYMSATLQLAGCHIIVSNFSGKAMPYVYVYVYAHAYAYGHTYGYGYGYGYG
jgi:hypothetical protein